MKEIKDLEASKKLSAKELELINGGGDGDDGNDDDVTDMGFGGDNGNRDDQYSD